MNVLGPRGTQMVERPIFVATEAITLTFVRDGAVDSAVTEAPVILDCSDLRAAQRQARRLPLDVDGLCRVSILRVYTADVVAASKPGVVALAQPRALASLAIDLRILGIAEGIIVHTAEERQDPLECAVSKELHALGYRSSRDLTGWSLR